MIRVLVIEDSPTQAMQFKLLLEEQGYHVTHAPNGKKGLDAAREIRPDLIISDVKMPVMDGYEMCRTIKHDREIRNIPVILLTTLSGVEDLLQGLDVRADCFVTKPYKDQFLLSKVELLLSGSMEPQEYETEDPIELYFSGKSYTVTSNRRQILNVLLSVYENAVLHNRELINIREALEILNEKLQEKLHELEISEERYRDLVMTIPDIIYRIDRDGNFIFVNDAIKRLGYEPEEIIGKHFSKIIMPSDVEKVSRSVVLPQYADKKTDGESAPKLFDERRVGKRKTSDLEIRLVVKGQKEMERGLLLPVGEEVVIVEVNSSGLWGINPDAKKMEHVGTVGVIRDITDRKQMEMELKESETRFRTIFDTIAAGIVVIDPETHIIVEINPAAVKMMGASKDQAVGSVCHEYICPSKKEKCPATGLEQKTDRHESSILTSNGEPIPILKTVTLISFRGRAHLLESFVDISDLKRAEKISKERSSELQTIVNAMSGRELRMAELKQTIRSLHIQLKDAGLTPVADDPLKGGGL